MPLNHLKTSPVCGKIVFFETGPLVSKRLRTVALRHMCIYTF